MTSDLKIHLFGFALLGSSIMVAKGVTRKCQWWYMIGCLLSDVKTPSPMSLQHCDLKISIWCFIMAGLWDHLLGCSKWLLGVRGLTASSDPESRLVV